MTSWGWTPERTLGIWRHGAPWAKPLVAAVPWITLGVLLLMLYFVSGTLTAARGTLFDLPDEGLSEGEATGLVALAMPRSHETLVFFDDARYAFDDASSVRAFVEHLSERVAGRSGKTLLVLADRRIACGDLMKLAAAAKRSGVEKVLFAEKKRTGAPE